jgi:prophage regulatory protein
MESASKAYPPGALVRVKDICGDRKRGRPGLLPINPATWYDWVKSGRVPPGRKLGENTVAWPIEQVLNVGVEPVEVQQ